MDGCSLILDSSGNKGAYEIGVLKACQQEKIPINQVVGASMGAVNAALVAQQDYDLAAGFWNSSLATEMLKLHTDMTRRFTQKWVGASFDFFRLSFLSDLFVNKTDAASFRESLSATISEKKIRASDIQLNIITARKSSLFPVCWTIDEVPEGELIDHLLIAASLPPFRQLPNRNTTYAADAFSISNTISIALQSKNKTLITTDSPDGLVSKKCRQAGKTLITIQGSEYLDPDGVKNTAAIDHQMTIGYLDTMKELKHLKGRIYYFNTGEDHNLYTAYKTFFAEDHEFPTKTAMMLGLSKAASHEEKAAAIQRLIRQTKWRDTASVPLVLVEIAGKLLHLPRDEIYTPDAFILKVIHKLNRSLRQKNKVLDDKPRIQQLFSDRALLKPLYSGNDFILCYCLFTGIPPSFSRQKYKNFVGKLPSEFKIGLLFFTSIKEMMAVQAFRD